MKAVIQRVLSASVSINGEQISYINQGLLLFLDVENEDDASDLDYLVKKTIGLRIFNDKDNNMNLSIQDVDGEVLVVSQFTLCADTKKGLRPSFIHAAPPLVAESIYQKYCEKLRENNISVKTGKFGSVMEVELINDGPVTIIIDTKNRK